MHIPSYRLPIPIETINLVESFYTSDGITRLRPGKKDFISIRDPLSNARIHEQKRFVLGNLKEIYEAFKEANPWTKIGFPKFAELRPKHCVLADSCMCSFHQRIIKILTKDSTTQLSDYHVCMVLTVCEYPDAECYFGDCSDSAGMTKIKEIIQEAVYQSEINEISFKQWVSTDRTKLLTTILPIEEFIEEMDKQLESLLCHDFIPKKPSLHLKSLKN